MDTPFSPDADLQALTSQGWVVVCMGTDLVHLPRIENLYQKYGHRFLDKVLTPAEKQFCLVPVSLKVKVSRIASRIAAKEATVKSLGIGVSTLGHPQGSYWTHVELLREEKQAPKLRLHEKAAAQASALGAEDWLVSLSHDGDYAMAVVMGVRKAGKVLSQKVISL